MRKGPGKKGPRREKRPALWEEKDDPGARLRAGVSCQFHSRNSKRVRSSRPSGPTAFRMARPVRDGLNCRKEQTRLFRPVTRSLKLSPAASNCRNTKPAGLNAGVHRRGVGKALAPGALVCRTGSNFRRRGGQHRSARAGIARIARGRHFGNVRALLNAGRAATEQPVHAPATRRADRRQHCNRQDNHLLHY